MFNILWETDPSAGSGSSSGSKLSTSELIIYGILIFVVITIISFIILSLIDKKKHPSIKKNELSLEEKQKLLDEIQKEEQAKKSETEETVEEAKIEEIGKDD